jgi:hypothetical protein
MNIPLELVMFTNSGTIDKQQVPKWANLVDFVPFWSGSHLKNSCHLNTILSMCLSHDTRDTKIRGNL